MPDQELQLSWSKLLPAGLGTKRQRSLLLTSSKQLFTAMFHGPQTGGRVYSPTTKLNRFSELKRFVRWMTQRGVWRFVDLRSSDLIEFLEGIKPARTGKAPSERTVAAWIRFMQRMWELRSLYRTPIQVDPTLLDDEIRSCVRTRPNEPWKALTDADALVLIRDALAWLREHGPFLIEASETAWLRYAKTVGWTKRRRKQASKKEFEELARDPRFDALARSIDYSGPTHKLFSIALTITEGACVLLLLVLEGQRVSELLALDAECLVEKQLDDGTVMEYILGVAAKDGARMRHWVAGEPVPEVVRFLVRLFSRARESKPTTTKALLLARPPGSPWHLPSRKAVRYGNGAIENRLEAFATSGLRKGALQVRNVHPHMLRKTFAQLAVKRDKTLLEPVSAHFGHVFSDFTDDKYVGVDHELASLLEAADREELVRGLEALLTAKQVVGGAAAALEPLREKVRRFRGKRQLARMIDELIAKGVKLAPCDWGFCVYTRAHSACKGDDRKPNDAQRSPDVCSTCKNFTVTDKHLPYWNDRYEREERFLLQEGLSEQTIAVVNRRHANTSKILRQALIRNVE